MRNEFLVVQPLERATVGDLSGDFIEVDTSNMGINIESLILIYSNQNYQVREVTEIGRYEVIEDIATYIDGYRLNAAVTLSVRQFTRYESVSLLAMYLLKLMASY
jgi:hypothetical protein